MCQKTSKQLVLKAMKLSKELTKILTKDPAMIVFDYLEHCDACSKIIGREIQCRGYCTDRYRCAKKYARYNEFGWIPNWIHTLLVLALAMAIFITIFGRNCEFNYESAILYRNDTTVYYYSVDGELFTFISPDTSLNGSTIYIYDGKQSLNFDDVPCRPYNNWILYFGIVFIILCLLVHGIIVYRNYAIWFKEVGGLCPIFLCFIYFVVFEAVALGMKSTFNHRVYPM